MSEKCQYPAGNETWLQVQEVGQNERHFNSIQSHYRILASTWLLALFAGVGFLLTADQRDLPVAAGYVIAALGALAAVGLVVLWILDLLVYQALLRAWFDAGVRLEHENPPLPQVRSRMLADTRQRTPRLSISYCAMVSTAVLTSWLGLAVEASPPVLLRSTVVYVLVVAGALAYLLPRSSRK